jgi:hypothetical protein
MMNILRRQRYLSLVRVLNSTALMIKRQHGLSMADAAIREVAAEIRKPDKASGREARE